MSSTYYNLATTERTKFGSKESKNDRKSGLIPAVIYYSGEENIHISIDKSVLFRAIQSSQRIYQIEQNKENRYVMIKDIQYHPVTDEIIHVDLMRVRRSEKITISVPIVLKGNPVGVREGGVLSQSLNQVEINCFPTDVPESIELDIGDLELNAAKNVGDLNINIKDVEIVSDSNLNIVSVTPPASEAKEDEETEIETDQEKAEAKGDDDKESSEQPENNEDNT
tara:strand:+ start:1527 stop:2198 length:672 start_codon:yes stop_codon:yes gene_type:complete